MSDQLWPEKRASAELDEMRYYQEKTVIKDFADPKDAEIIPGEEFTVGTFLNEEKQGYFEIYDNFVGEYLGG